MENKSFSYWFNYKTDKYECIDTPTDFTDYIPQMPAAQGLYQCHIAIGKSPIEACKEVLTAIINKQMTHATDK